MLKGASWLASCSSCELRYAFVPKGVSLTFYTISSVRGVCVRACVRVCVRACVCVCVRACGRACPSFDNLSLSLSLSLSHTHKLWQTQITWPAEDEACNAHTAHRKGKLSGPTTHLQRLGGMRLRLSVCVCVGGWFVFRTCVCVDSYTCVDICNPWGVQGKRHVLSPLLFAHVYIDHTYSNDPMYRSRCGRHVQRGHTRRRKRRTMRKRPGAHDP